MVLAGCNSSSNEDTQLQQAVAGFRAPELTPRFKTLVTAGAPQLEVAYVSTKQSGVILLEHQRGAFDYWLSSDGVQIILENGMMHGTRGTGDGLLASELSQPMSLVLGLKSGASDRFHTYLDGNDKAVTRTYRCQIDAGAKVPLVVAGKSKQTRFVTESCNSLDQEFTNLYWVDPSQRRIVQSRQWIGPLTGYLSTRVVN